MTQKEIGYRKLGKVTIGAHCIIDRDVIIGHPPKDILRTQGENHSLATRIGPRCILRSGVIIYATASISRDVEIGHHVVVRERAQIGEKTKVGAFTEIDPDVRIGRECRIVGLAKIANKTVIGARVFAGPGLVTANRRFGKGFLEGHADDDPMDPPVIEDGVLIGPHVTLNPGVRLGRGSIIAAGSVVTRNIAPGSIVMGIPGRVVGSVREKFGRGDR